ncbi:MAG: hypothetical protein ACC652_14060, partial [Acidimicrobiales bacterium]
ERLGTGLAVPVDAQSYGFVCHATSGKGHRPGKILMTFRAPAGLACVNCGKAVFGYPELFVELFGDWL